MKNKGYSIDNYAYRLEMKGGKWYVNGKQMSFDEMIENGIAKPNEK
jgi:hypothetical protein